MHFGKEFWEESETEVYMYVWGGLYLELKVKSASKYIIVSYTSLQFTISFALFWFLIYLGSLKTS